MLSHFGIRVSFSFLLVVKMSKNEIKKQVIYLYVFCYWPLGLLEDCSSRPGSVCVVLSVEREYCQWNKERESPKANWWFLC